VSGYDRASNQGGGLYVYKDSYAWAYNENNQRVRDLFPYLMEQFRSS